VWEMAQARFFATMKGLPMWEATRWCAGAAGWDVAITTAAYAVGALATLDLRWPLRQHVHLGAVAAYLATGLAVTVAIERWALRVGHWRYTDSMPLVVGIGLTPLLQWIAIPLLVLGVVRRRFLPCK
ncbi:MAG: hypothetical protein ABIP62_15775, partial [Vicinamibacteria bacterium]